MLDDGGTIRDSTIISEYIEAVYPESQLYSKNPGALARQSPRMADPPWVHRPGRA